MINESVVDSSSSATPSTAHMLGILFPSVVMVVGAGRGPLVEATLKAANSTGRTVRVYAVEKNPGAVNT